MKTVAAVIAGLLLAAPAFAADYVTNAADIVKAADWKAIETVEIAIDEHSYAPETITLKANQPYRLVLKNSGEKKHYFTAAEFYKSIATRKAQSKDAEFKAPYFTAIEVAVGGTAELWFVPVKAGSYEVICTIDDHQEKGMEGVIVVQ